MNSRVASIVLVAFLATSAYADNAQPRGGGSGSHASGPSGAQARHPQAGHGTGAHYGYSYHGHYYPYYGRHYPYYYGRYPYYYGYYPYASWGWPYWGFGLGFSYNSGGYYAPYPYYGYPANPPDDDRPGGEESGPPTAIRLLVDPPETRVYVDGNYAGKVDDFDGMSQRLYVPAGRHEITLQLDGYKTHHIRIYAVGNQGLKLRYGMVKGNGEDAPEDLAGPARPEDMNQRPARPGPSADDESYVMRAVPEQMDDREATARRPEAGAELRLSVRPDDASVYVDGEFRGTARQLSLLQLAPGRHHVEVVRPGFRTAERDVDVNYGTPASINVELERP